MKTMRWWFIGRKVIKRPTNIVASLLLSILWCVVIVSRLIINYEVYDYNQTFIIPISIVGGLTFIYIFMLILEIRRIGAQKHIKTAEELYQEKYGVDEKEKEDPLTEDILNTLKNLGVLEWKL